MSPSGNRFGAYRRALAGIAAPDLEIVGFAALTSGAYDVIAVLLAAAEARAVVPV